MDSQVTQDLESAAPSYDAVDPLEFFPLTSGSTLRACLNHRTNFKQILDLLIHSEVYSEGEWKFQRMHVLDGNGCYVRNLSPEQQTAALFNEVFKAAVETHPIWQMPWSLHAWRSRAKSMVQRMRKPDVVLVERRLQDAHSVTFGDIITCCEVKQYSNRAATQEDQWRQIAEMAGLVVASQVHRRFFIGFSLCGSELRLVLYARGAVVSSRPFNIDNDPLQFIKVLLNLSFVDSVCHGFDENFIDLGKGNFELYVSDLKVLVTPVKLFHSLSIKGRGTKVSLYSKFPTSGKCYHVIKDCWLVEGTTEVDIHNHLTFQHPKPFANEEEAPIFGERDEFNIFRGCSGIQVADVWDDVNLPGIPVVTASEIPHCCNPSGAPPPQDGAPEPRRADTTAHILSRFTTKLTYEARTHVRVLSSTCGTSLAWFSCRREFLNGLMCAIAGHFNGLRKDVLHCDVSDTNVWFVVPSPDVKNVIPDWPQDGTYTKRAAVLGDWGLAEICDPNQQDDNLAGTVTVGTYPFLASELLSDRGSSGEVRHEVHHDLESFFWLLWITCVNLNGPYLHRRLWEPSSSSNSDISQQPGSFIHHRTRLDPADHLRCPDDGKMFKNSDVPAWATPGLHSCSRREVFKFKFEIPAVAFLSSLSPYFSLGRAGEPIIDGLKRLRQYVAWTIPEKGTEAIPPKERLTHKIFIEILQQMRDEIPPEDDFPTEQDINRGRWSYQKLTDSGQGLHVPVMQEPTALPSQSRSTSEGVTVSSCGREKRSRGADEDPSDLPTLNQHSSRPTKRRRT